MFGKKKDKEAAPAAQPAQPTPPASVSPFAYDPNAPLPLFYASVEPLDALKHADLRLAPGDDAAFASAAIAVPLSLMEFEEAARFFPIVFSVSADKAAPLAVIGARGKNLFLDADGRWRKGVYAPAYVRRYPFIGLANPGEDLFGLGVDVNAQCLASGGAGKALFENGAPSETTKAALAFCKEMHHDHVRSVEFASALLRESILQPAAFTVEGEGARANWAAHGFHVIDFRRLEAANRETYAAWAERNWLAAIEAHLASQNNWRILALLADPSRQH